MENTKLWGGRFNKEANSELKKLNSSINTDKRLYAEDIAGSQAYAEALTLAGLLTEQEAAQICKGLDIVKQEWDNGTFVIKEQDEDIHTANERRLNELIGDPARKLHVGRSRNDQVATDMKLWLKSAFDTMTKTLKKLIEAMTVRAAAEIHVLMPGYTHLQKAQPVRWSHWILSHAWNFKNDTDKLQDILKHTNVMPLGSGALAGNAFSIDRLRLAYNLGFNDVTQNSMQTVGDRDFIADFLFWASLVGIHLSRLAEDLILFSTAEFGYVTIDEMFSTGSSLMPQKKNPDSLELVRGIGASIFGQCNGFMMILKSLPSTYNKDLQGDKESMFATYDKLISILKVTTGVVESLKVNFRKCTEGLNFEMLATDLAYYLVRKDVPFREAHCLAGKVVAEAEKLDVPLNELDLEQLKVISEKFAADVEKVWNFENSVEQYQAVGGTSRASVLNQIALIKSWLSKKQP